MTCYGLSDVQDYRLEFVTRVLLFSLAFLMLQASTGAAMVTRQQLIGERLLSYQETLGMGTGTGNKNGTAFGPNGCVSLAKTPAGTCVLSTNCGTANTSNLEFAFVCLNPDSHMPRSLHSFGFGGFKAIETFDTKVKCSSCTTVDHAMRTGGSLIHNDVITVLAKNESVHSVHSPAPAPVPSTGSSSTGRRPQQAALFGPSACIATFLSSTGTCLIQTRCKGVDLANYAMGITCLDGLGDYTRYLFGKGGFAQTETFDTTLTCKACLGAGDRPVHHLRGLLPKTLVEDVSRLKSEVGVLRGMVHRLRGNATSSNATMSGSATSGNATSGNGTSGNATSGNATSGNATSSNATGSNAATGGSATNGNATSGNATSGNATSSNATMMQEGGASAPVTMQVGASGVVGPTFVSPVRAKTLKALLRHLAR